MTLLVLFFILLGAFLLADLVAWILGDQTMSQYLIAQAKRNRLFRWCLILILVLVPWLLMLHWELIRM